MPTPKTGAPKKRRGISKKDSFLAAYARTASITHAARAARVDRALHYRWLAEPEYAASFAATKREAGETLKDEAIRRAHEGVNEPIVYQGEFTYKQRKNAQTGQLEKYGAPLAIRKYSDSLMMFLLRGMLPEFRERSAVEVSGVDGAPIALNTADPRFQELSDADLASLIAVAQKLNPDLSKVQ